MERSKGEQALMEAGTLPLRRTEPDPRLLIQTTFEADMEAIGQVAGSAEIRGLHARLVAGEITKDIFLETVRKRLEEYGAHKE